MGVKNTIVAGDFKGSIAYMNKRKGLYIYPPFGLGRKTYINKETVESYEVIDSENNKSMSSGVARGIVGGALFGGVGAIAGAASGKKKGTFMVSIVFRDGKKCLCELDGNMYKNLIAVMY